jgi:hypothetical protein
MEEYVLDYSGPGGHASQCQITIYPKSGLVIATDLGTGTSVTNAVEQIASEVLKRHHMEPDKLFFIEHYTQGPYGPQETADLVIFDQADTDQIRKDSLLRSPRWQPLPIDEYREIIATAQQIEEQIKQLQARFSTYPATSHS